MTVTVRVSRVTDGPSRYEPSRHRAAGVDDWYVCWSPLVAGAYTAFRDQDAATEHAHRLWLRYGATVPVVLHDGLPA